MFVNESTREFSAFVDAQLPDGVYSARATQSQQRAGDAARRTSSCSGSARRRPSAHADARPPHRRRSRPRSCSRRPPTPPRRTPRRAARSKPPYVCKSRRDFVKHVPRPSKGKNLKVTATLNGKPYKHTLSRKFVLVRLDLRGMPKDTYTLKVTLKFTRPDGKRVIKNCVERIDYHTCMPKGSV